MQIVERTVAQQKRHDRYMKRRDAERAAMALYSAANRERLAAGARARYAADPVRHRAKIAEWQAAHPERVQELNSNRSRRHRARRFLSGPAFVDRAVIWQRDEGVCHCCGLPADPSDWHMDHIIPLCAGGVETDWNLGVTHPKCNNAKNHSDPRFDSRWGFLMELLSVRLEVVG